MKLKVIRDTVFKLSDRPSPELPDLEKVNVTAGKEFKVHSYRDMGHHVKVALLVNDDELHKLKGRNTWIAYEGHIEIFDDNGVKIIPPEKFEVGSQLPKEVNIPVPWFSQRDNEFRPTGTCNVTSVAMCLYYYGIRRENINRQLEDELFLLLRSRGWDRRVHEHLRRVFIEYGVHDVFKMDATWQEVKTHLANQNPVIYSGQLTNAGHIIVLRGYDQTGFWVNDPWGEFFHSGYQWRRGNKWLGENLHYSYELLKSKSNMGSEKTWAHFPEKR